MNEEIKLSGKIKINVKKSLMFEYADIIMYDFDVMNYEINKDENNNINFNIKIVDTSNYLLKCNIKKITYDNKFNSILLENNNIQIYINMYNKEGFTFLKNKFDSIIN